MCSISSHPKKSAMNLSSSMQCRLETQYQSIETILSTINNKRIELKPAPDKWNIHDNVAHLVRYQQIHLERFQQTLQEEEPFFGRYNAEGDSDFEYWRSTDMAHLLEQMTIDRKVFLGIITDLITEQSNRLAMHKKYGSHNIIQWTEFFLLHEAHHIFTIFKLAYDIEMK